MLESESTGFVVSQTTAHVIAVVGLDEVIVVDTEDALLVTNSAHAQLVKNVVGTLHQQGRDSVLGAPLCTRA